MNELLKHASMYEYENTGDRPQALVQHHKEDGDTEPYEIGDGEDTTFAASMIYQLIDPTTSIENPSKLNGQQDNNNKEKNGKVVKDDKKGNLILLYSLEHYYM